MRIVLVTLYTLGVAAIAANLLLTAMTIQTIGGM